MQQGHGDLAFHPFTERQVAHRLAQQISQVEQLRQLVDGLLELRTLQSVDGPVALKGIGHGQIPDQLVAVAHDQRDLAQEIALASKGLETQDAHIPVTGIQQAGEHLQRRRLAGAVGPEEADDLAGLHVEGHCLHRLDVARAAVEQTLGGVPQAGLPLRYAVRLRQGFAVQGGHRDCDLRRVAHQRQSYPNSARRPRSPSRTWAALYPGSPVTFPDGWQHEPHRYSPSKWPR